MARTLLLILSLVLAAAPACARDTLGIYENWGAFREAATSSCFAIATPVRPAGGNGAEAASFAVGYWPRQGIRAHIVIRLSKPLGRTGMGTLTVGDRRFPLTGNGNRLTAASRTIERAIIAALRGTRAMSISAVGAAGQPVIDAYDLRGAATAIDAAALACLSPQ